MIKHRWLKAHQHFLLFPVSLYSSHHHDIKAQGHKIFTITRNHIICNVFITVVFLNVHNILLCIYKSVP